MEAPIKTRRTWGMARSPNSFNIWTKKGFFFERSHDCLWEQIGLLFLEHN
jgi:hypothetical protein